MSFRFLRIASHSQGYIPWFYAQRPGLAGQPYADQHAALMYDGAERADFYSVALRRQFDYEAEEIVGDAEPLQKQWAREHGISYGETSWMSDIALAQVQVFRPEILFASSWLAPFGPEFIQRCRASCPSIKMIIGRVGETRPPLDLFRSHDLVISCAPDNVAYLSSQGLLARHLHHAFEPRLLERLPAWPEKKLDIGFVGHLTFGEQYHNNRIRLFYQIARQIDFTIYGLLPGVGQPSHGIKDHLRNGYYALFGVLERLKLERLTHWLPRYDIWQRVLKLHAPYRPMYALLGQRTRPPVYGLEMYRTLAGFKVCLNAHGPAILASNLRLYEATGVGTCLLTDWKPNLSELFEPDAEVAAYHSVEEAVEKARYLVDHDTEREAMAAAGQRRTLRDHTMSQRCEQLHSYITEFIQNR